MARYTLRRRPIRVANRVRGIIIGAKWLGYPARILRARVCRVIVGDSTEAKYWAREFVGQERGAVEMTITPPDGKGVRFYLDNEDGLTVEKLTVGAGDPLLGHRQLLVQSVLPPDASIKVQYGFTTKV
jgi:hypothetical protein